MRQQKMGRKDWVFVGLRLYGCYLLVEAVTSLPAWFLVLYVGGGEVSYGSMSGVATGAVFVTLFTFLLTVVAGYALATRTSAIEHFLLGRDADATPEESASEELKQDFRGRQRGSKRRRSRRS